MKRTLYEILGVGADASAGDIAAAYAKLAAKGDWSDPNTPSLLRQANEVLSDPQRRRAYDASLAGRGASATRESAIDPDAGFIERWGKWIVGAAVLAAFAWWATSRREAPAPRTMAPQVAQELPAAPDKTVVGSAAAPTTSVAAAAPTALPQAAAPAAMPAPSQRSAEDVFADAAPSVARVNVMDATDRVVATGSGVVVE